MILLEHLDMTDRIEFEIDGMKFSAECEVDSDQVWLIYDRKVHGETYAFTFSDDNGEFLKGNSEILDAAALAKSQGLAKREKQEAEHETYLQSMERRGR